MKRNLPTAFNTPPTVHVLVSSLSSGASGSCFRQTFGVYSTLCWEHHAWICLCKRRCGRRVMTSSNFVPVKGSCMPPAETVALLTL